jgi:hypothetical protein
MNGAANAAAGPGKREFDRIDGELEAAMVFAAAADSKSLTGRDESASCVSDATTCYARALAGFFKADLTAEQRDELKGKLIRLEQVLSSLRRPRTQEAM